MPLAPGDKLGSYEILSLLGKGGMGEVYRAKDAVLKRDVALKVMPAAVAHDPDRLARFQREAEVLASLDHPNIGPIYGLIGGLAESNGTRALVLALIEGPTLADRIRTGPLPLDEALPIARQMIEALEYAHDRGVIHRDLKPANVKVTPEGTVKVLDFGLAKVLEVDPTPLNPEDSPTITLGHTRLGTILGTAAYMSPEQAVGKQADRRSDIFSFGVVLYEMLTGERAFRGETPGHTLAAVVKEDPDWTRLPSGTPKKLTDLLRRCLSKDRKQRLQAVGEARIVLQGPLDDPAQVAAPVQSKRHLLPWALAAASTLLALAAGWIWLRPAAPPPQQVVRFKEMVAPGAVFITVSPDGSSFLYIADRQYYLRTLGELNARPVNGTEGANLQAAFSPDGKWIAFLIGNGGMRSLKKVPVAGGTPQTLVESLALGPPTLSWGADDGLLVSSATALLRVPASGGKPEVVTTGLAFAGQLLPTGKLLLSNPQSVSVLDRSSGKTTLVLETAGITQYVSSEVAPGIGHLIHWRDGSLFATPFDPEALTVRGPTVPMEAGVLGDGAANFWSVSNAGTMLYRPGRGLDQSSALVWVDRKGRDEELPFPPRGFGLPKFSPDGNRFTVDIGNENWVYDLQRNTQTKLQNGTRSSPASWTSDGNRLAFIATTRGQENTIVTSPADGGAQPTLVVNHGGPINIGDISKDDVLIGSREAAADREIWFYRLDQKGAKIETFLPSKVGLSNVQFSPDTRWVSYVSQESGRQEIYAAPFPGPGPRAIISSGGGRVARWHPNGKELVYAQGDKYFAVDVDTTGPTLKLGTPKLLFEKSESTYPSFDIHPDDRFLMTRRTSPASASPTSELHVVVNWFEDLRRKAPVSTK